MVGGELLSSTPQNNAVATEEWPPGAEWAIVTTRCRINWRKGFDVWFGSDGSDGSDGSVRLGSGNE